MSDWLMAAISLSLTAIEFYLYFLLADIFFTKRRTGAVRLIVALVFFALNYALVQMCKETLPRVLLLILSYMGMTLLLYQAKPLSAVFTSALWLSVLSLLDVIVVYSISILFKIELSTLWEVPAFYLIAAYLSKAAALILIAILSVWGHDHFKKKPGSLEHYLRVSLFPITTLMCGLLLFWAAWQAPEIAIALLVCVVFLLITDLLSLFLVDLLARQQDKLNEAKLLQQQLDSAMDNITAAAQSYRNERKLTHDFQNHLLVLRGMLEGTDDREKIIRYLDEVSQYNATSALAVSTNRLAVDVLLNQKYLIAAQKGISFRVRLDDLSGFPLPDNAFVVLLSSLLDNAIEACARVPNGEREILVKASVAPESCLLCIENSVAGPVEIQNNLIPTTKPNPSRHGYGLKNVAAIVKAYDGFHTLDCDAKRFRFVAEFPGPQRIRL